MKHVHAFMVRRRQPLLAMRLAYRLMLNIIKGQFCQFLLLFFNRDCLQCKIDVAYVLAWVPLRDRFFFGVAACIIYGWFFAQRRYGCATVSDEGSLRHAHQICLQSVIRYVVHDEFRRLFEIVSRWASDTAAVDLSSYRLWQSAIRFACFIRGTHRRRIMISQSEHFDRHLIWRGRYRGRCRWTGPFCLLRVRLAIVKGCRLHAQNYLLFSSEWLK